MADELGGATVPQLAEPAEPAAPEPPARESRAETP